MRSSEFRVLKGVVCVLFALLQRFATFFEFVAVIAAPGRLKFVWPGTVLSQCSGEGCWGRATPGSWLFECCFLATAGRLTLGGWDSQRRCGLGYMDRGGYYRVGESCGLDCLRYGLATGMRYGPLFPTN